MAGAKTAGFGKRGLPAARAMPAAPEVFSNLFSKIPFFMLGIAATLICRFAGELRRSTDFSAPASPAHFSLLALGAANRVQVVDKGEWWRLFTSSVLHASPDHLAGNLVALLVAGFLLEPLVGMGWFAAIYVTGALAGALVSILCNPPDILGVGASGAIMATLAALFVLSFHAAARRPVLMRWLSGLLLFPALVPAMDHGATIDINAHLGGLLTGVALAYGLLLSWREEEDAVPPVRGVMAMAGIVLIACTAWSFTQVGTKYRAYAAAGRDFIPPQIIGQGLKASGEGSYDLVEAYPNDPRAHLFRGLYFVRHKGFADAEPHLRDALRLHPNVMTPRFRALAKALLAVDLSVMGRRDEARPLAAQACSDPALPPEFLTQLRNARVCS